MSREPRSKTIRTAVEAAVAIAVAFALPQVIHQSYYQGILVTVLLSSIVALGLQLIMGYAGQISLGQAGFMGVGAYTAALLTKAGLSFWLAVPLAGAAAGLAGFVMGPIVRLKGAYFAMASLAFNIAITTVFANWDAVTNGTKGLLNIPMPKLGPITIDSTSKYLTLCLLVLWLEWKSYRNIVQSGFGRVLRSIRDNETATVACGINVTKYKMLIIAVGCSAAGVAGAIMAHYKGIVSPEPFGMWQSIILALILVIGGLGSLRGAVVGAFVIGIASEYVGAYAAQHRMLIYGIVMLLFMMFLPDGLDGLIARAEKLLGRKSA